MAPLDFGAIPTGKVNFDPNVHPSAGQKGWRKRGPWGARGERQGRKAGGRNVASHGGLRTRVERAGRAAEGPRTPLPPWPFPAKKGRGGGRRIAVEGWDFAGASLPASAPSSCRAPASGWRGGRCAGNGRCAEPPLECAECGCRRAGGEERTPRRRGTARRGSSPPRAPGPAVGLPPCFILSFNLFFPHLYFDPLGFFFPPFPAEPPSAPVPSLSSQFGFFFFYILIFFLKRWTERGRDREGRRKALSSSPPPPPPRLAERGRAERRQRDQPLTAREATPARGAAGGSCCEEGTQKKRCIETFRANFGVSA
ncbi:radial spoke head protein 9 homolog isoform X1 [Columba livia]|uniref:radial spoke head protein 9 homolog isoform X1 n=1 Tax=Columba livia TaxID=8932 RepID=UPI0031BB8E95